MQLKQPLFAHKRQAAAALCPSRAVQNKKIAAKLLFSFSALFNGPPAMAGLPAVSVSPGMGIDLGIIPCPRNFFPLTGKMADIDINQPPQGKQDPQNRQPDPVAEHRAVIGLFHRSGDRFPFLIRGQRLGGLGLPDRFRRRLGCAGRRCRRRGVVGPCPGRIGGP